MHHLSSRMKLEETPCYEFTWTSTGLGYIHHPSIHQSTRAPILQFHQSTTVLQMRFPLLPVLPPTAVASLCHAIVNQDDLVNVLAALDLFLLLAPLMLVSVSCSVHIIDMIHATQPDRYSFLFLSTSHKSRIIYSRCQSCWTPPPPTAQQTYATSPSSSSSASPKVMTLGGRYAGVVDDCLNVSRAGVRKGV